MYFLDVRFPTCTFYFNIGEKYSQTQTLPPVDAVYLKDFFSCNSRETSPSKTSRDERPLPVFFVLLLPEKYTRKGPTQEVQLFAF